MATAERASSVLTDGRVLFVGNQSAELYSPTLNAFLPATADPLRIDPAVMVTLANGSVLAAGGTKHNSLVGESAAELYNPLSGTWATTGSMAAARQFAFGFALPDGRAIVTGGGTPSAEIYNASSGSWTSTGSMSRSHARGSAALLPGGDVLVVGGDEGTPPVAEVWNHLTGAWSKVTAPPQNFCDAREATVDSTHALFVAGRTCTSDNPNGLVSYIYNPHVDNNGAGPVTLTDHRVLLVGRTDINTPAADANAAEVYDVSTDLWSSAGRWVYPHWEDLATVLQDGRVLVTGSSSGSTQTELYTHTNGSTVTAPDDSGPPAKLWGAVPTDAQQAHPGRPIPVVAHLLTDNADRLPIAGEAIMLWSRPAGADEWTLIDTRTTDAMGGVSFDPTINGDTQLALRHTGSPQAGSAQDDERVVPAAPVAPSAPVLLAAAPTDAGADVSWAGPSDDGGSDVTSYSIVVGSQTITAPATATSVHVSGLTNGTRYDVSVSGVSSLGTGRSALSTVVPTSAAPAPSAGTELCGRVDDRTTVLTAARSPYRLCAAGLYIGFGGVLTIDATTGPVVIHADGGKGVVTRGGDVRTVGSAGVTFDAGSSSTWGGLYTDQSAQGRLQPTMLQLDHAVLRGADGINVADALSTRISNVSIDAGSPSEAVSTTGTPTWLDHVTVARNHTGAGVLVDCACAAHITNTTVTDPERHGILIRDSSDVVLRDTTVTGSRSQIASSVEPAVILDRVTASIGPGGDVDRVQGGGNAMDAMLLSGRVTSSLTWVTPTNSSTLHPLGHLLGDLTITAGHDITIPAGGVVKAMGNTLSRGYPYPCQSEFRLCAGRLALEDGAIHAEAGGTVFTSVADATVGLVTCPSMLSPTCTPSRQDWHGIQLKGHSGASLNGASIRYAATALDAASNQLPGTYPDTDPYAAAISLTSSTIQDGGNGILGAPRGSTGVSGSSFRNLGGDAVDAGASTTVTTSTFSDVAGNGVSLTSGSALTSSTFSRIQQIAVTARGDHPRVAHVVITDSGHATSGGQPAMRLAGSYGLGPGQDVDDVTGGGNAMDAMELRGTLTSDATWVTPSHSSTVRPLGYYLPSSTYDTAALTVAEGYRLVVPADAVVAGVGISGIALRGGGLDASAGGALFTDVRDPSAAGLGYCASGANDGCAASANAGITIYATGGPAGTSGSIALRHATMRDGGISLSTYQATGGPPQPFTGSLVVNDGSVLDHAFIDAFSGGSLTVDHTTMKAAAVSAQGVPHVRITDNIIDRPLFTGITVTGSGTTAASDVAVARNSVTRGGHGAWGMWPAIALHDLAVTVGPGGQVDGNTGALNQFDALSLDGVRVSGSLNWVSVRNGAATHPLGYVAGFIGHDDHAGPALTVAPGGALVLPKDAVVRMSRDLLLDGASLDATAGGAVVTTTSDATVGPAMCQDNVTSEDSCYFNQQPTLRIAPEGVSRGAVDVAGATLRIPVVSSAGAVTTGTDTQHGLSIVHTRARHLDIADTAALLQDLRATDTVTLTGSSTTPSSAIRSAEVAGAAQNGLVLKGLPVDLVGVALHDNGADGRFASGAGLLSTDATGSWSCLDVQHNATSGVFVSGTIPASITDSTIHGNAGTSQYGDVTYDVDDYTLLRTTGVFWGQPGGPKAGQVRDSTKLIDLSPADAPPPCSLVNPTVPPSPVTALTGTDQGDGTIALAWQPPADDGGSPVTAYVITTPAGNQTVVTGTSTDVPVEGTGPSMYEVRARNAVGDGAPAVTSALGPPAPADPTPTPTPTASPTATASPTPTASPTATATVPPTAGATPTASATPSATATATPTQTGGNTGGSSGGTAGGTSGGTSPSSSPSTIPSASPTPAAPTSTAPAPEPSPAPAPQPPAPAAPAAPTIDVSPSPLVAGHSAAVTGHADAGVTLELWARSRPASTYRVVRTTTAASDGSYRFSVTPSTTTDLFVRAVRDSQTTTGRTAVLPVRSAVSLAVGRAATLTYRFSGSVLPRHGGVRISLYRSSSGGGVLVATSTTASTGAWSVTRRFSRGGTYTFYAVAAATSTNAAGTSGSYRTTVR